MPEQTLTIPDINPSTEAQKYFGYGVPAIKNAEEKAKVFDVLQLIKGEIKRLDADRKKFTDPLRNTVNSIIERYNLVINPLKTAETNFKNAIEIYDREEAARIAKENERLRVEAEERARKEKEKLEKQAEKAAEKGNIEKAESLRAQAQEKAATPIIAPTVHQMKTPGLSYVDTWDVEIIDKRFIPIDYLMPDIGGLEAFAKRTQGKSEIPGVKFNYRRIVRATSR